MTSRRLQTIQEIITAYGLYESDEQTIVDTLKSDYDIDSTILEIQQQLEQLRIQPEQTIDSSDSNMSALSWENLSEIPPGLSSIDRYRGNDELYERFALGMNTTGDVAGHKSSSRTSHSKGSNHDRHAKKPKDGKTKKSQSKRS